VAKAFDARSTFGERVHIVHVYVIEAHPKAPDVGPFSGLVSEARYSTIRQPRTYAEREAAAREMEALLTGQQRMLVDDLGGNATNPFWCTYGTCANCAFLIRRDGAIDSVQLWLDVAAVERSMETLLERE
jgi:hypothetical protein